MSVSNTHVVEILLVEDNPGDVRLTREALRHARIVNRLQVAIDGTEALDILFRKGSHEGDARPDLVVLDLNLPRRTGHEVLAVLKQDATLRTIPVIILTSSAAQEDVERAYNSHANCFVTKPLDFTRFADVVRKIEDFWLATVRLPAQGVA